MNQNPYQMVKKQEIDPDWYCVAEQLSPALHLARPEGRAAHCASYHFGPCTEPGVCVKGGGHGFPVPGLRFQNARSRDQGSGVWVSFGSRGSGFGVRVDRHFW